MKTIQPVSIWYNGSMREATTLQAYVINDNLIDSAIFYYSLTNDDLELLASGNLKISGDDYISYETNLDAWNLISDKLNLIILV